MEFVHRVLSADNHNSDPHH